MVEGGVKTPGEETETNSCEGGSDESTPTARPTAGSPHPAITNSKASRLVRRTDSTGFIRRLREYDILKYPHMMLIIIA